MRPLVDVLVTVYNGADHVRIALESLQAQTFPNFLIHVVDDGSDDPTPSILRELAAADQRIKVYTKTNGGVVEASNFGLKHCGAEFIARLDADDISYPDRLERQVKIMKSRPEILALSGNAHKINIRGVRLPEDAISSSPLQADPGHLPAIEPYLLHPFLMVRKEALMRVGGYRHLSVSEDSDLYWRLMEIGEIWNDDYFYGEYRMNPGSLSSRSVQSGRIMAIYSQLAAISAMRRREGKSDIQFTKELAISLSENSFSLESLCSVASVQLSAEENLHLRAAAGIKLLEMASYRPYEIDMTDCIFLAPMLKRFDEILNEANRGFALRNYSGTAARLASSGRWKEARTLLNSHLPINFWVRYLLRKLMPDALRRLVRDAVTPLIRGRQEA